MFAMRLYLPLVLVGLLMLAGCKGPEETGSRDAAATQAPTQERAQPTTPVVQTVLPGIDVLRLDGYRLLRGKRVGLLTHPAAVSVTGVSSIQLLHRDPRVNLVALYGPEHGIYGNEPAGAYVPHKTDQATGLPVYSLYGKTRKPTPEMLAAIDVMLIDLQDIGTRSYTYISAMANAMEACFEAGIAVVVTDRPNPLGGLKVSGPPLDAAWASYVGEFPGMPYVHGLTIAEIARMAKAQPHWLEISQEARENGRLTVVPMRGWNRAMTWPDTGLRWRATSPYIQDLGSVLGYPMTGLGGIAGGWSHGIGTPYPFRFLRHEGKSPEAVQAALTALKVPGMEFRVMEAKTGNGQAVKGVYTLVSDWAAWDPTELNFQMMLLSARWAAESGKPNPFIEVLNDSKLRRTFLIHVGSEEWLRELSSRGANARLEKFLRNWEARARGFQRQSSSYYLYR